MFYNVVDLCHVLRLDYLMTILHMYRLVTTQMGFVTPPVTGEASCLQDVKRHDDPELVVLPTDECLFADEGFR